MVAYLVERGHIDEVRVYPVDESTKGDAVGEGRIKVVHAHRRVAIELALAPRQQRALERVVN
jgi:hypothetical protein